jgi:phage portal protein BeeE
MGIVKNIKEAIIGKQDIDKKNFFYPFGVSPLGKQSDRYYYEYGAILSTTINKRSQYFGNSVLRVVDSNNNDTPTVEAGQVMSLLQQPNKLMTWKQFYSTIEVYRMLYGYCPVLKASAFKGDSPQALFIINPAVLDITFEQKNDNYIGSVIIKDIYIGGSRTSLTIDDLIIFNDTKIGFGKNPLFAQSRLSALGNENKLLQVISDAELSIIRNRGALGILSKDINDKSSIGAFEDDKENIQEQYRRYGITSEQWNIIITSSALKWQSITQPLKDLMLLEFEERTAKKICGVFDIPFELLPLVGQSTYSNRKEAKIELYQDYVIPCSVGDAELLTAALCPKGIKIMLDYSNIPALQEQLSQKATATATALQAYNAAQQAGNITRLEWRRLASEYIDINPNEIIPETVQPTTQTII